MNLTLTLVFVIFVPQGYAEPDAFHASPRKHKQLQRWPTLARVGDEVILGLVKRSRISYETPFVRVGNDSRCDPGVKWPRTELQCQLSIFLPEELCVRLYEKSLRVAHVRLVPGSFNHYSPCALVSLAHRRSNVTARCRWKSSSTPTSTSAGRWNPSPACKGARRSFESTRRMDLRI